MRPSRILPLLSVIGVLSMTDFASAGDGDPSPGNAAPVSSTAAASAATGEIPTFSVPADPKDNPAPAPVPVPESIGAACIAAFGFLLMMGRRRLS